MSLFGIILGGSNQSAPHKQLWRLFDDQLSQFSFYVIENVKIYILKPIFSYTVA
jgi:hypothetical protein